MNSETKTLLNALNIGKIEIEPEYVGDNDYRFSDSDFVLENGYLSVSFDLEVCAKSDFSRNIYLENIKVLDEESREQTLTRNQYSAVYRAIENSIEIKTLVA